ncbi:response regulator transcription factor [Nocardia yamanashiensis]|uniref:response regulator transcription factor n=1 Tax=Nocardia yamanashiensis TaxID=209247 RepID=UPI001E472DE5|nr:response regulator transcription factor [Nocardia yamanashiensis]UGT44311.1 response regulator transcription factor [Nocardia yamanashiensis]
MIRVLVAEDVRILREALIGLLALEDDLEVVAGVESGEQAVDAAMRHGVDVAVLDIELPGMDGLQAAEVLRDRLPSCRVLILTGVGRPGNLRRGIAAKVAGFMLKDARPQDLVDAIRVVARGGRVLDPQLAYATLDVADSPLTERETDVLRELATGASPREVGTRLHLSYGTVRNYLASAVTKLDARNRVDAINLATGAGWL